MEELRLKGDWRLAWRGGALLSEVTTGTHTLPPLNAGMGRRPVTDHGQIVVVTAAIDSAVRALLLPAESARDPMLAAQLRGFI